MSDAAMHPSPVTWDQFVELDEDDPRELIDGVLVETEVNELPHEYAVAELVAALHAWAKAAGGVVLASNYKVRVSDRRGVMPDVQYTSQAKRALLDRKGFVRAAPDLVVEVVSPTSARYDRVVKLRWYAEIGVGEYWIVDPDARTLERLVLADGRYTIADSLTDDATFEPPTLPGLTIRLADLWV